MSPARMTVALVLATAIAATQPLETAAANATKPTLEVRADVWCGVGNPLASFTAVCIAASLPGSLKAPLWDVARRVRTFAANC